MPSIKIILLSFTLMCQVQKMNGQTQTVLDDLTVFESNGNIHLLWTITSGNICNGIQIYRSTDSVNFDPIGEIPGVCGSSSTAKPYSFTDLNPVKNKINYYRIELGGLGFGGHIAYELIDIANKSYQVRPNPIVDEAKLYFSNEDNIKCQFILYNLNRISVLTLETNESFFNINVQGLIAGIYCFQIVAQDRMPTTNGKLIVQH